MNGYRLCSFLTIKMYRAGSEHSDPGSVNKAATRK